MTACRLCGHELPVVKTCYLCGRKGTGQYRPMPDGRWVCRSGYACQKRIRASARKAKTGE